MKRCSPVAMLLATTLLAGTIWVPNSARASRMPQEMPGPVEVGEPDMPTPREMLRSDPTFWRMVLIARLGRVDFLVARACRRDPQVLQVTSRSARPAR